MKKVFFVFGFIIFSQCVISQVAEIGISTNKTASLIFPQNVVHVDRGSKDILVQRVKGAANVLLLKGSIIEFPSTNLTVILDDGAVFSIDVSYHAEPMSNIWRFDETVRSSAAGYAFGVLDNRRTVHGVGLWESGVKTEVIGIYVKSNELFFQLRIRNESTIDFDIDFLRYSIKEKSQVRKTTQQEISLIPSFVAGNSRFVRAGSENVFVVVFDKFTIPRHRSFRIQINEKEGARNFDLRIPNRKITKAIELPQH